MLHKKLLSYFSNLQNAVEGDSNPVGTIAIRAIEPEYRQVITTEPLTERELEVLQLIVDGYSNIAIATELYITVGTVKTHVRNVLQKLCAEDRTQAAIRALRSVLSTEQITALIGSRFSPADGNAPRQTQIEQL